MSTFVDNQKNSDKTVQEVYNDEITIGELIVKIRQLFGLIWKEKKNIFIIIICTVLLGLAIDFSSGKEFEAENSILTYTRGGTGSMSGNLSGLAGIAGLNVNNFGAASGGQLVSESMLPMLISTYPVGSKLAEEPLRFYNKEDMSAYTYFREVYKEPLLIRTVKYIFGFPRRILSFLNPSTVQAPNTDTGTSSGADTLSTSVDGLEIQMNQGNEEEYQSQKPFFVPKSGMNFVIEELSDRIEIVNEEGVLIITARMPDAYAAADLASSATDLLMQEMTNFEVRKTRDQLKFLEEQYEVSRERFEQAQVALAEFTDQNRGSLTAMAQIQRQRLQNDFDLAYNIYSTWSRQVEETRMKLREDTPLFTELDPVQLPNRPARPAPVTTVIISLIVGTIFGIGYVIVNKLYQSYKPELNSDDSDS